MVQSEQSGRSGPREAEAEIGLGPVKRDHIAVVSGNPKES